MVPIHKLAGSQGHRPGWEVSRWLCLTFSPSSDSARRYLKISLPFLGLGKSHSKFPSARSFQRQRRKTEGILGGIELPWTKLWAETKDSPVAWLHFLQMKLLCDLFYVWVITMLKRISRLKWKEFQNKCGKESIIKFLDVMSCHKVWN
jgi:hypothetical protein